jgi:protein TonB
MTLFQGKVALRVLGIHVGIILCILMVSGLKGCFRPKPKPEIVTFIDFGQPAPPVAVQQVEKMAEPEPPAPEPAPQPEPEPVKLPEPAKIPEKPKKTIKTPPKKVETPKPVKKEPEKPKWKPTKVSDIDISKSKKIEPVKPAIDPSEIDLSKAQVKTTDKPLTTGPVGNPDADAAYISQIGRFFDQRWSEPAGASPSSSAIVRVYISQWGTITRRTKIQGSGDAAFDASVMAAVNSVSTAPKPPSGFPYDYVEVEFRLRN